MWKPLLHIGLLPALLLTATLAGAQTPVPPALSRITIQVPAVVDPATQQSVMINLEDPYPFPLEGRLSLSFSPNTTGPAFDDPALMLLGGSLAPGRTVNFQIPAGTTSLRVATLLTGTVAGVITLKITQLTAQGQSVLPGVPVSAMIQIPRLPPVLTGGPCGSSTDPSALNLTVTGFSTTRDIVSGVVTMNFADGTQQIVNLDLKSLFDAYFASPGFALFGSQFLLTVPLSLPADTALLSTFFTLTNSAGASTNLPGACVVSVQPGLSFRAVAGAGGPPSQVIRLFSGALSQPSPGQIPALNFTTTVTTTAGGEWLGVSPASGMLSQGQSSTTLQVSVDPSGLAAGNYYGQVRVVAPGAPDSPQSITVVLNLLAPETRIIPEVSPLGLVFTGSGPTPQPVRLSNLGTRSAPFTTSGSFPDGVRFTVTPSTGILQPGQALDVQVQPDSSGAGVYRGTMNFMFPDGNTDVNLLLIAPAGGPVSNVSINKEAPRVVNCLATKLLPQVTQFGSNFRVSNGWPGIVQVEVRDDCGELIDASGVVKANFSNGDSALPLTLQRDGKWLGTWTPLHETSPPVQVTINAQYQRLEGTSSVNASANPNQDTGVPVLNPEGVLNATSLGATDPAPGELISVLGRGLATTEDSAGSPLPTNIRDTQLTLSGRNLPLASIRSGAVTAVMPYGTPSGATLMLSAKVGTRVSVPISVRTTTADPAILVVDASESGQGQIFVVNDSGDLVLASPDQPARKGDLLLIRSSGLGAVDPGIDAGVQAPVGMVRNTVSPVAVTIGDITVDAVAATLSTNSVGVYEVKVVVPDGVQPGDRVAVSLTVAQRTSPSVTIAVR